MAQQQNPYYGTGFYQPSGTYVQPQQMTAGQQQQQQAMQQQAAQAAQAQYAISQGMLPLEQSYIENILRLNKGKQATVVMTYERGSSLGTQSYTGIIEAAGRDHIVISEPQSGKRYLLLMIYLDYVEFPEEITYLPSQQATYAPRP
ncbi:MULTISPECIES: spore coat protein GerQ [Bacillus]|jgi:spore germination protein Q|uniref:Spore coat protein GerQ n=13 Tax=Bacillus cereus group TaxID=86661 RepID=A0AAC8SE70_BACAN|nr:MULTISPECIES: spore coat protein GerQ [Bacillus]EDX54846.1 spore coat protein GerQ [Bacillus cereus W]EDX66781.1 spore coat protein GerQ [Bacillus cereus NVH0597-99]EEL42717.1 Spore coat protein GerQ [Bacillus cereus Rock3-42]EFI65447.1 spore coat protein GerQ [Bacillus cereus SJ1]EJT21003.1 spore coat protein GerQ [Bacillus anthracis str. UR-1]EXJ17914.1 spore coat protein GerQ [Bacillus anthracis str. 95014]MCU0094716.1 spore coat protein GerQ [Bacillus sp. OR9]MDF4766319.1 spore coat 